MDYDQPGIASRYVTARHLPTRSMRVWLDAIGRHVPHRDIRVVLDVGSGTGRFSTALASEFDAEVIGLDPSRSMLSEAQKNTKDPRVRFVCGTAERVAANDDSVDLVFMSMVYHHLRAPLSAFRDLRRVLRNGCYLCVRNSTIELLDKVPYLRFFPQAIAHNRARLPSQRTVIDTAREAGFSLVAHELIEQQLAQSLHEYYDKISIRGLSDLVALSDEEFAAGLARMRTAAEQEPFSSAIVEPIDLFVFQNGDRSGA